MTTSFRAMAPGDLDAVASLESENQPRPWSLNVFRAELESDDRSYLVAVEGNEVVGFGGVMVIGEEAHVTNLLVRPESRSGGIGRRLVVELVDEAMQLGARHLTLEVRSKNQSAIRLYSKLGLAPVGIRPGYYGDDDAMIMWAHDIASLSEGGNEFASGERRDASIASVSEGGNEFASGERRDETSEVSDA